MKLNQRIYKIISVSIFSILLLGFMTSFYLYFSLRSEIPKYNGEIKLLNLNDRVSVRTDNQGIPHIFASNNEDAFRSLGYIVASERLFQMEMQRRMADGELSEIFGEVTLNSDKLFRALGIRKNLTKMIQAKIQNREFEPEMLKRAQAFYDGVNQFQASGNLPIEYKILKIKPRPFSIYDGYTFIGLMSFSFGIATTQEPLLTSLKKKMSETLLDEMRNEKHHIPKTKSNRIILNENNSILSKTIADLESGFNLFDGSNGWLLSGKKTASGNTILANDPHISFSHPGVWFEAHIKTPDYETYGHFLSIIPFPILAHNSQYGWGLTMSLVDDMDLFAEEVNFEKSTYRFKGKDLLLAKRTEVIKVNKSSDEKISVYSTHHGPILDEFFKGKVNQHLSLSWAFLSPENDPLSSLYKMGTAKNISDFKNAVSKGIAPGLNILYADKNNIAWWMFGEIRQKLNPDSDFILDGSSGLDELAKPLAFQEKPHLENPPNGFIVSANSRPMDLSHEIRGDWQPDDRYKTISKMIQSKELLSIEDVKSIQVSNTNLENAEIIKKLLGSINYPFVWDGKDASFILDIVSKWDLNSSVDSIAPTIFYTWAREILRVVLKDLSQDDFQAFSRIPNVWIFFKRVVINEDSPWWKKFNRKEVFNQSFKNALDYLKKDLGPDIDQWNWGRVHQLELIHPIGKIKPLNFLFNIGPVPVNGAYNEINNQKPSGYMEGFSVKAGPSVRRIIEFGDHVKAFSILPAGNSGHILSPYYRNQLNLYLSGKFREEYFYDDSIKKNSEQELILSPVK